jgi:MoxR-like ATPase
MLTKDVATHIRAEAAKALVGQEEPFTQLLIAMFSGGHVLLEGVPGTAKTLMAKTLAALTQAEFKRVQFTPDLMPSDVIGTQVFEMGSGQFRLQRGPIFTNVLLGDEINRAPAKTQSALLEAMEERQITVDGTTHVLPQPFIVLATQNPIEYEGTFPLPEAQLDRFLLRVHLGYAEKYDEITILRRQRQNHPIDTVRQVASAEDLLGLQERIKEIYLDELIEEYIVALVTATRHHEDVYLGASTRGALSLYRTAQARAAIDGRDYVIPDDVKALAEPVLGHRLIISPAARIRNVTAPTVMNDILGAVPVPGARAGRRFEREPAGAAR